MTLDPRVLEQRWLDNAYHVASDADDSCFCKPTSLKAPRWPGYLGSRYHTHRVLFVGAVHKANRIFPSNSSRAFQAMKTYEAQLVAWGASRRTTSSDLAFITANRNAHLLVMPDWAKRGVWQIFNRIRTALGLNWDEIAFTNLARCHSPANDDDELMIACQNYCPLSKLVEAIEPRIVFLAKAGIADILVEIPGESKQDPLVVRYSNHSSGKRNGLHYSVWIPLESPTWRRHLRIPGI